MATAGPNIAGTGANNAAVGASAWTPTASITANDNALCQASGSTATSPTTLTTNYLVGSNFGFAIPAGATINGIQFGIEKYQHLGTGSPTGTVVDAQVRAMKGGVIGSTDRADGTTQWHAVFGTTFTDGTTNHGSISDLWGTTWAASDINASNFGVAIAALITKTAGKASKKVAAAVDVITATITYTPAVASLRSPSGGAAYSSPMFY